MLTNPQEINTLLRLMDDPDQEVFSSVSNRIISLGSDVIPYLEHHWETNEDPLTQDRVEMLIHRLQWQDLKIAFSEWINHGSDNLIDGLMLLSKHRYPEYDFSRSLKEIDKFKRNIWLELNGFMTPLEQVNVLCNMLFNYYKLKGNEVNYAKSDEFLLTHVIETKNGNAVSNTMLILVLSELFDINIKLIGIPRQFILGCFDAHEQILFYLDGATGIMYSEAEVHTYFKRVGLSPTPSYFKAKDNTAVISAFLSEYKKCFNSENQSGTLSELEELLEMLNRE